MKEEGGEHGDGSTATEGGSARVSTLFFFEDFDIKVPAVLGLHEASTAFRSKSDSHLMQNLNFRRDERAPWLRDATVESRSCPHALRLTPKLKLHPLGYLQCVVVPPYIARLVFQA